MEDNKKTGYIKGTGAEVKFLKGVGETRARMLAKLGIHRVIDFMEHFPRNYISREINPALHEVQPGDHLAHQKRKEDGQCGRQRRTQNPGLHLVSLPILV
jgi:RecG-like helicase